MSPTCSSVSLWLSCAETMTRTASDRDFAGHAESGCGDVDSAKPTHGVERKYNTYLSAGNGAYILNNAF